MLPLTTLLTSFPGGENLSYCSNHIRSIHVYGSVLAPLLFLCYINDLPTCISSTPWLLADDCLIHRRIVSPADAVILQQDLDRLQMWAADWLMQSNQGECEVIIITKIRRRIDSATPSTASSWGRVVLVKPGSLGYCGNVANVPKAQFVSYSRISYFGHACLKLN